MIKIFVTGDNHFGRKYGRYPEIKDILLQSRFDALEDMIKKAEEVGCSFFVVTGDLFDNVNTIKNADVRKTVDILAGFNGDVIVLPGNHDYYTGEEKVWKDFESALAACDHNITLIKEFKKYEYEVGEDKLVFYPAFCQSKHSGENNLEWIREAPIQQEGVINVGIAHGAIQGITPDINQEYFKMTESELLDIPMDVWLIGHTHIPYPDCLREDADTVGYKIFNAGTHEQTDLHNNTEGNGFIISIDKAGTEAKVMARKFVSGRICFRDLSIKVKPDSDTSLADAVKNATAQLKDDTVVRLKICGSAKQAEYREREKIYKDILGRFLTYEKEDNELGEEITTDKIRSEFAQTSFAAKFLEALMDDPAEAQMAYHLLQECRMEGK